MQKNKSRSAQDKKLIASKQQHEVDYLKNRYGVPKNITRQIITEVGRSRTKVYEKLRELNYPVPPKRNK